MAQMTLPDGRVLSILRVKGKFAVTLSESHCVDVLSGLDELGLNTLKVLIDHALLEPK